jgi:L-alanine-DL-glutamate epimerase-like enolase superfamily enzyme
MLVQSADVWIVEIPQTQPLAPYRSHVRSSSTTKSGIVRLRTDAGLDGWGEFNLNFLPGLDVNRLNADAQWIVGRDPLAITQFHLECPLENRLKSGIELATWDLAGKAANQPVAMLLGGIIRSEIELAACMGIQSYERAKELASYYVERGFTTLKTKAGSDADEDYEMARGVYDAVGDKLHLRLDPNRAYSPQQAADLAQRLEPFNLQYFEQPIPADPLSEAHWLRQQTTTPIALNESVVEPDSVHEILCADAASHLLPDTHIAGGIWPCVKIGVLCEAAGIPAIMHCGHDLGLKTAAMVQVAAACPAYSLANDSSYYGLERDITVEPLPIDNGRIKVPKAAGLGVEGDLKLLEKYAVPN